MKNDLVSAGVGGFREGIMLFVAIVVTVMSMLSAFAHHETMLKDKPASNKNSGAHAH